MTDASEREPGSSIGTKLRWARLIGLAAVVMAVAVAMAVWGTEAVGDQLREQANRGWVGVAAFIFIYALAVAALVPGSAPTATAGAVYGAAGGTAVAVIGATIGSVAGYLISRTIGRRAAEETLAPRVSQIESWLADHQFRTVLILRLLPIVPFSVFNYAAGLTPIRLVPFTAATLIGIIPGSFLLASAGDSISDPTSPTFLLSVGAFILMLIGSSFIAKRLRPTPDVGPADSQ